LAGSVGGSSALRPFTCLEAIPPVVVTGHTNTSRRVARISSRLPRALASILPARSIAGHLATPFITQLTPLVSRSWLRSGGEMLLKIAFVLLIAWLLGVVGLYRIGDLVHVLLLIGLMLLLLGALKARDAAVVGGRDVGAGKS
jgi:hypothetical protein